jgi:hypothetical protein
VRPWTIFEQWLARGFNAPHEKGSLDPRGSEKHLTDSDNTFAMLRPRFLRISGLLRTAIVWAPVIFASVLQAGCDDGRIARVPVSGKVLIDGRPATIGSVRFYPQSGQGRPSSGTIQPDGSFSLFTFEENDGIPPGVYDVTVSAIEIYGNDDKMRYHLPKKYTNRRDSGITKSIEGATDSMLIELTWGGEKPETFEGRARDGKPL